MVPEMLVSGLRDQCHANQEQEYIDIEFTIALSLSLSQSTCWRARNGEAERKKLKSVELAPTIHILDTYLISSSFSMALELSYRKRKNRQVAMTRV
jgi:hypothetical protein